jgi:hypothetical protein
MMVAIALAWIPVIKNAQGLYNYLQSVQSYLATLWSSFWAFSSSA